MPLHHSTFYKYGEKSYSPNASDRSNLEQSVRSIAFQAAAFTVEEAIKAESLSTESMWFTMYDYTSSSPTSRPGPLNP